MRTLSIFIISNLLFSLTIVAQPSKITDGERALADSIEFSYDILKLVRSKTKAVFKGVPKDSIHKYPALALNLERKAANVLVNELNHIRYRFISKGYIIFKAARSDDAESDEVRILKYNDPLYPIEYIKTKGTYPRLSTQQIYDKIERWHGRRGGIVTGAGKNWVELKFVLQIKNTQEFAKEIINFCPALESVYRGSEKLSEKLKENKPVILLEW